jgi:iron-sulfur cluster assembly protein
MITLTPGAAVEVKRLLDKESKPNAGLRLGVKGGGCSGLSYTMNMDTQKEGDQTFDSEGVRVFVDSKSYVYLDGIQLDFVDSLQGRGFKFENPNAKRSCGCGESFTP